MPKRYPEEFRREVLDLVAASDPVHPLSASATLRESWPDLSDSPDEVTPVAANKANA